MGKIIASTKQGQKNVNATVDASLKTGTKGYSVRSIGAKAEKPAAAVTSGKKIGKPTAKKAADKAGKAPTKKAATGAAKAKTPRGPRTDYSGKKIKALVKSAAEAGLREGSKRAAELDFVLKHKATDEVLGKTVKARGNEYTINGARLAGMVERGHITLS